MDSACRFYDRANRISPNVEALRKMGILMGLCGQYPSAIGYLEKAAIQGDREARRLMGYNLFRLRRYEEALVCFEATILALPGDGLAWYWRGLTLIELGRISEAEESFNRSRRE